MGKVGLRLADILSGQTCVISWRAVAHFSSLADGMGISSVFAKNAVLTRVRQERKSCVGRNVVRSLDPDNRERAPRLRTRQASRRARSVSANRRPAGEG